jgi:hypothetical protein
LINVPVGENDPEKTIPERSDVHWKIGSYWNLPILPIPNLPIPMNLYWKLPMHIKIYIHIYES